MNARLDHTASEAAAGMERTIGAHAPGSAQPQAAPAISPHAPAAGSPAVPGNPADLPNARKYLIFAVMAFGQFMALLDIQIVAASLNEVQSGLSAAPEEISWVQTGYLMAELVMIPLSAFLAQALSTRWLFALSAALFTISSAMCGIITSSAMR